MNLADIFSHPSFLEGCRLLHETAGVVLWSYRDNGQIELCPVRGEGEICRLMLSSEHGRRQWMESDIEAAKMALRSEQLLLYKCRTGLTKVVIPVIVAGEKIGCFYCGPLQACQPAVEDNAAIREKALELGLDPDKLYEAFCRVPIVDPDTVDLALRLLRVICARIIQGESAVRHERKLTVEQRQLRKAAEEKAAMERHMRELELRLVSAQLNPHFLFNGLNLIMGSAMKERASETMRLIEKLAAFLRMSLIRIGSMVSLAEEVRSARAYVEMFQARFAREVNLTTDIPPTLARVKVPALILQPLVENALIHGLPGCTTTFRLCISASLVEETVQITVSDNGRGLSPDQLTRLRRALQAMGPDTKTTGLLGLNWRLRYYYSGRAGVCLEDTGEGLTVVISVPRWSSSRRKKPTRPESVTCDCVSA